MVHGTTIARDFWSTRWGEALVLVRGLSGGSRRHEILEVVLDGVTRYLLLRESWLA